MVSLMISIQTSLSPVVSLRTERFIFKYTAFCSHSLFHFFTDVKTATVSLCSINLKDFCLRDVMNLLVGTN